MLRPGDSPLLVEAATLITPKIVDMGALMFGERLDWAIKEMWVNVLDTGGLQAMHNHANSFVSGVVYLTPTHPDSQTVFMKSSGGTEFRLQERARQHNADAVQCRQMGQPGAVAGRPGAVSELCDARRAAQPGRAPHHAVVQRHPRRTGLVGLRDQVQRLKRRSCRRTDQDAQTPLALNCLSRRLRWSRWAVPRRRRGAGARPRAAAVARSPPSFADSMPRLQTPSTSPPSP